MTSPLCSLEFTPRGSAGWTSGKLDLGPVTTLVLGPNGSGKTPLLKGMAYSMGHPLELPPDITADCRTVVLWINGIADQARIERKISSSFEVSVQSQGRTEMFLDQKSYSAWFLRRIGIPLRTLAARDGSVAAPYVSVVAPMFWIDQDLGWRNLYSPLSTHNFINDQQDEVSRWLLGTVPKHHALDKSAFQEAKQQLDSIAEQLAVKRKTLEALQRELGPDARPESRDALLKRRGTLLSELEENNSTLQALLKSTSALDSRVDEARKRRDAAKFALEAAEQRIAELRRLGEELTAEVGILETNELAADAFRNLCGNETCQFFRRPEESYGRRLLYLKDQLKDFQSSFSLVESEITSLRSDFEEAEKQLATAVQARQASISDRPSGEIVRTIDAITRDLSQTNLRLDRMNSADQERKRFEALVEASLKQEEEVKRLRPTGGGKGDHVRLNEIREALAGSFRSWLGTLNAQNIPGKIWFDEDLRLNLGAERFSENSPFSGSTRTRIVLAYHAAVMETSLEKNGSHPHFLILDTPRQHELHHEDLSAFVKRFEEMSLAQKNSVQLVIAATEEDFASRGSGAVFWRPTFGTADSPRFFGVPSSA